RLERKRTAATRLPSGVSRARAQPAARRVADGVAVAPLVGRGYPTGDRGHLPAPSDATCGNSCLRGCRPRRRKGARSGDREDGRPRSVPAASGARGMHERTAYRLAMLANGFQPLLNDCKRSIEKGWPTKIVDEAEGLSWDRSALTSTGL